MKSHGNWTIHNRAARNSAILQYVGAAIVFLTFIVKDGVRDSLKDVVQSIESARNTFLIRRSLASDALLSTDQLLWSLTTGRWLNVVETGSDKDAILHPSKLLDTNQTMDALDTLLKRISLSLDVERDLAEAVHDPNIASQTAQLEHELTETRGKLLVVSLHRSHINFPNQTEEMIKAELEDTAEACHKLSQRTWELMRHTLDEAELVKSTKEGTLRIWT